MHKNQEREGAQQYKIGKYPNWPFFVVEFGGTSVWVTKERGRTISKGRWSEPRPGRVRHSQWGARDAGANEISGEERLPVEW